MPLCVYRVTMAELGHAPELCTTAFGLEDVVNGAYGVDISLVWI